MLMRVCCCFFLIGLFIQADNVIGQEPGDPGVIVVDSHWMLISINQGVVELVSLEASENSKSDSVFNKKTEHLTSQISRHLELIQEQEERVFSDEQSLYRATSYARTLVEKVELLIERLEFLGKPDDFSSQIQVAANSYDVAEIKRLLGEKLALEDEHLAEAAFQLGGFQELDGEYQDAWANYQRASNLQPQNQLYMDAHGKNQF
jgi:tetratricopeptide (TPR) repeat protein